METQLVFVTLLFTFVNKFLNPLVYITRYAVLRNAWIGLFHRMRANLRNQQPPIDHHLALRYIITFDNFKKIPTNER